MTSESYQLPILVGSRAALTHQSDSDYDLILPIKYKFYENFKKKQDGNSKIKIDILSRSYDLELCDQLNAVFLSTEESTHNISKKIILDDIEVLVPSCEFLAMIYLSSVIRIVPYFENHNTNTQIWYKRIKTYNKLRSSIDYKKFDQELMDPSTLLGDQYKKRFEDKINTYGDSIITLEEDEETFFKDSVHRHFDHDRLHLEVGELNRGERTLLFPKFQDKSKTDSVGLDQTLFENGLQKDKLNMVQEEILTLMLERKIIPALDLEQTYDICQFDQDLINIASHFATNLCGKGHHFLRKWVLDHFTILMSMDLLNIVLVNKAYELCEIKCDKNNDIKYFNGLSKESLKCYQQLLNIYVKDQIQDEDNNYLYINGPNRGILKLSNGNLFYLEIYFKNEEIIIFKEIYCENTLQQDIQVFTKQIKTVTNHNDVTEKKMVKKITVKMVHRKGYYNSVSLCMGYGDGYRSRDEEIDRKTEYISDSDRDDYYGNGTSSKTKKQIRQYYLNSFGSGQQIPLYEKIARKLLNMKGKYNFYESDDSSDSSDSIDDDDLLT